MTKKNNLEDNAYYQQGKYTGKKMAQFIANTTHKTLENAIIAKRDFGEQLKNQLGYDESNPDYAENLGIIAALEEAYKNEEE